MNKPEDVLIFGIGGAGCRVIRSLLSGGCPFSLGAIDTDKEALAPLQEGKRVECILAGSGWTWREGSGCGGDVIRGEQAVAKERHAITEVMEGRKLIVTVAGLGGGVATGGCRTIASVARALKIPALFLLVTPFSFESFARRKNAEECIEDLLPIADIVMRIPNDLLFSMLPSETPFEEAFAKSCEELARSAVGVCGLLSCEDSLNSDYAGFMAMLKGKKCSCGLGVGCAEGSEGLDRCGIAVERMLESPFLGEIPEMTEAFKTLNEERFVLHLLQASHVEDVYEKALIHAVDALLWFRPDMETLSVIGQIQRETDMSILTLDLWNRDVCQFVAQQNINCVMDDLDWEYEVLADYARQHGHVSILRIDRWNRFYSERLMETFHRKGIPFTSSSPAD